MRPVPSSSLSESPQNIVASQFLRGASKTTGRRNHFHNNTRQLCRRRNNISFVTVDAFPLGRLKMQMNGLCRCFSRAPSLFLLLLNRKRKREVLFSVFSVWEKLMEAGGYVKTQPSLWLSKSLLPSFILKTASLLKALFASCEVFIFTGRLLAITYACGCPASL